VLEICRKMEPVAIVNDHVALILSLVIILDHLYHSLFATALN
jgi:hypothetical protein